LRIGFTGKAGSGKSSLARFLERRFGYVRLSFAEHLKQVCEQVFPDLRVNKHRYRRFLQVVGTTAREIDPDVWIRHLHRRNWLVFALHDRIVVDDVRFLNEAAFLRSQNFVIVRVVGRGYRLDADAARHVSETEMDKIEADFVLDNSGDFAETCRKLVDFIRKFEQKRKK